MVIKSAIECKGPRWEKIDNGYKKTIFETQQDIFKVCLSIGILYDRQKEDEKSEYSDEGLNIPANMFNRNSAEMQFFFQTAILTSKCVNLNEKDRLYLAFSDDISEEELDDGDRELMTRDVTKAALEFNKIEFLRKFANFGASKLEECLSDNEGETLENLNEFIKSSYKGETEELKAMKEVEDLIDDELLI